MKPPFQTGLIGEHHDHRENQAEKQIAFPLTHGRNLAGRNFLRLRAYPENTSIPVLLLS
jgi:hypothetical protein